MTVYVDRFGPGRGRWAGHMFADSTDELVDMARALGLKDSWIQKPGTRYEHFDLTHPKRDQAIALGAQSISLRESARIIADRTSVSGEHS